MGNWHSICVTLKPSEKSASEIQSEVDELLAKKWDDIRSGVTVPDEIDGRFDTFDLSVSDFDTAERNGHVYFYESNIGGMQGLEELAFVLLSQIQFEGKALILKKFETGPASATAYYSEGQATERLLEKRSTDSTVSPDGFVEGDGFEACDHPYNEQHLAVIFTREYRMEVGIKTGGMSPFVLDLEKNHL
jgi:hypothetical protein